MTTITYKNGVIAYDSLLTQGATVMNDDYNKRVIRDGVSFFFTGSTSDQEDFIDSYFGKKPEYIIDCAAFIYDKGKLYRGGVDENMKFWKCLIEEPASIGSGSDHALTAMDMGADAKTAVKMAMKRDTGTGGRIRAFKL